MGKRAEKSWKTTRKFHKAKHSYTQGMLTLTKYAFIVLAIVLAILAINFGRSKYILTGNQSVSIAFYRYTIAQSDITVEFPSNVLARITPTSAETTLMQNTGLIMQYKIDYTAANLADVGWTAYDSNNQPAILDDCTISCRYYGAAQTSGGVAFTGPETTKQVKMPKIKTLDGTTLILTKAGTADTTDSFVKAGDYYGQVVDYSDGNTSLTYRLFYVDFDDLDSSGNYDGIGKYGDTVGTMYLMADYDESLTRKLSDFSSGYTSSSNTKVEEMNPLWAAERAKTESNTPIWNENEKAVAYLCDTTQWTTYVNQNKANYAIGGASVEMYIDSYNQWGIDTQTLGYEYVVNGSVYGYKYIVDESSSAYYTAVNSLELNEMYTNNKSGYWWLTSPIPSSSEHLCGVHGEACCLERLNYKWEYNVRPLVSLKNTTIPQITNYVEFQGTNTKTPVRYYPTLAEATAGATSGNTIAALNDTTETTAPTLAAGKTAIIDLNDKTITLDNLTLTNNGTLNITGAGTLTGYGAHTIENRGIFTKNGTSTVSNTSTNYCTLINKGTATINDGTITANHVAISENGNVTLNITGGTVSGNYGIYDNDTGAINITTGGEVIGTNNLGIRVHTSTLTVSGENTRITGTHAITVDDGGNAIITGGTITGTTGWGVAFNSKKTLTIGDNSNAVNTTMPSITGVYGVYAMSGSTFNFYDGVIKGSVGQTISGKITAMPTNYGVQKTTATENDVTTETAILVPKNYAEYEGTSGAVTRLDAINNNAGSHSSSTTTWKAIEGTDGTVSGTATWGENCFQDDGASTVVDLGVINNPYETLEATFSADSVASSHIISGYGGQGGGYIMFNSSGRITGTFFINETPYSVSTYTDVVVGNKYHVALTYDGSIVTIYLNGVAKGTDNVIGTITPTTSVMKIGHQGFTGKIYSAAVYDRALTADEVARNSTVALARANNVSSPIAPEPINYYETLATAMSNVKNGNTIKPLINRTETNAPTLASGKTAIFDLNGKTVTLDNVNLRNNGILTIAGSGTLTGSTAHTLSNYNILTKTGTATIQHTDATINYAITNYGTATILGGTIESAGHGIYNEGTGHVIIANTTINAGNQAILTAGTETVVPAVRVISGNITGGSYGIFNNSTGKVAIYDGTITCTANYVIYNNSNGTIEVSGGEITGAGGIFNDSSGTIEVAGGLITGTASDGIRGANGNVTITGNSTIISGARYGVSSTAGGILTIGDNSDAVSTTNPSITGGTNGAYKSSGTFYFYDGEIKCTAGEDTAIYGTVTSATGYEVTKSTSNGTETALLAPKTYTVSVDPNGGTIPATTGWTLSTNGNSKQSASKTVTYGGTYGTLPIPTRTGYTFDGWYNVKNVDDITISASTGNFNYKIMDYNVQPGVTYTITLDATLTSGTATNFSTLVFDHTANSTLASVSTAFGNSRTITISCPANADKTHKLEILIYAGLQGSTANNAVSYTNIKIGTTGTTTETNYTSSSMVSTASNHTLYAHWLKSVDVKLNGTTVNVNEKNVGQYYGKAVTNYNQGGLTYRIFFIDIYNKYGDGEGTVYLIADYDSSLSRTLSAYTSNYTSSSDTKVEEMNPLWAKTRGNSSVTWNTNENAAAYLCDTAQWNTYANSNANYAIGGASVEMYVDSYNQSRIDTQTLGYEYAVNGSRYGYKYKVDTAASQTDIPANTLEINKMYTNNGSAGIAWWISSPSAAYTDSVCALSASESKFTYDGSIGLHHVRPLVSLKSGVNVTFTN